MPESAVSGSVSASDARYPAPLGRADRDRTLFARDDDPLDPIDRDAVVERFQPLARRIAARYQRAGEPFDDVLQVACSGLVKAVDRFDVDRGVGFSGYTVPTIVGEIKRHLRDHGWLVRVPRDLQQRFLRVERVVADLVRESGRQPSVDDVARAIGIEAEDVLEAMQAASAYRAASLHVPRGADEDAATFGGSSGTFHDGCDAAEQVAVLQTLVRSLTLREHNVIRLRFEQDLTRAVIGERLGVSQVQVSRILRQSIARLRLIAQAH